MIFYPDGKIGYHSIVFRIDRSGSDFVQYDQNGKEKLRIPYRDYKTVLKDISC